MKTYFDCIPCAIRQVLDSVRLTTDDEKVHEEVLREALSMACKMDFRQSPPAMAQKIHRFIREQTGVKDPYSEIKNRFNNSAMQMYPELKKRIETSKDPLETAARLAIAGNIIDFGVNSNVNQSRVEETITQSLSQSPSILDLPVHPSFDQIRQLCRGDGIGQIKFASYRDSNVVVGQA